MITLSCVLLDDCNEPKGDIFPVEVAPNNTIHKLKQKILKEVPSYLTASALELFLWKPKDDLALDTFPRTIQSWRLQRKTRKEANEKATYLSPVSTVQAEFHFPLPIDCVHLLVQLPTRENDEAPRIIESWRSKHAEAELPTLAELATIAECPLTEEEKIPLSEEFMKTLISRPLEIDDVCTADDAAVLFRPSEHASALCQFYFSVNLAPPSSGTENTFYSFWDRNIRELIELAIPDGESLRNSNRHTATDSLRPDFDFLVHNFCPFRGEEKAPDNPKDPKVELAQKLEWVYDPAPYVLGYYATGTDLTLAAICRPQPGETRPAVYDIVHADLRHRKERILNLRRIINLAGIIRTLARIVRQPNSEFELLQRENSTIEVMSGAIIKTYKDEKIPSELKSIYALLKENNVPNVDRPILFDNNSVVLSPRGIADRPKTEKELLGALECVLETLQAIHAFSLFHRDIRWPNVIKRLDDKKKWFTIDWKDAAISPTHARPQSIPETHSPHIFIDGHGAEVDIWGVGGLILQCEAINVSAELQDLGKRMQQMPAPSAKETLSEVRQYQSAHQ